MRHRLLGKDIRVFLSDLDMAAMALLRDRL